MMKRLSTETVDLNKDENKKKDLSVLLGRCDSLAYQRSILTVLDTDLRKHGFVGSTDIPLLVFLSFYTRIFKRPVSLIIKGPSGSGKSFALKAGKQYVPESAYEEFHGMSERALIYLEGLNLKHRYLIIQEAAGMNTGVGRVFLRQLLSEDKVNYATVQNTDQGLVGKRLPTLEGPMGAMMTTTANQLHPEEETRFISVHIEESRDRMKETLLRQARDISIEVSPENLTPWHALHDFICSGEVDVEIPYAESLVEAMPHSHPRVQRDFPQLLSLIKAHALLHQCTRSRNGTAVVATLEDYENVYRLVAGPLAEGLEAAVPNNVRTLVAAIKTLSAEYREQNTPPPGAQIGISQRAIADHLRIHASSVSRTARAALDQGYLLNDTPGQGRESTLMIGDRQLPDTYVLPEPSVLAEAIATPGWHRSIPDEEQRMEAISAETTATRRRLPPAH
jgi:hypothetical protein